MTIMAFSYVLVFGRNVPSWDDWDIIPALTGTQSITWEWLWSQHNEHRLPLTRLLMLAACSLFMDLRAGMLLNVGLMAAVTFWLLAKLRQMKGSLVWTDLVIPVLALELGQGVNFIWAWQIEFVASTALALVLLTIIARPEVTRGSVTAVGVIIVLLTGTGANGLAVIPAIVVWALSLARIVARRDNAFVQQHSIPGWRAPAALALIGVALVITYLVGYERVPHHPVHLGGRTAATSGLKAITMGFGPGVREVWPVSGLLTAALLAVTGLRLVTVFFSKKQERVRCWGLFCFGGAIASIAVALSLGRNGFEARYVTLLVPMMCGTYWFWRMEEGRAAVWVRGAMAASVAVLLWPNTRYGLEYGKDVSHHLSAFERDMVGGMSHTQLIARHARYLHPSHSLLTDYLLLMREAGVGKFSQLRDDPVLQAVEIAPEQWLVSGAIREGANLRHEGHAYITVQLPESLHVAGVALEYDYTNALSRVPHVSFEHRGGNEAYSGERHHWSPTGDRANWELQSFVRLGDARPRFEYWFWKDVKEIRIRPDATPGTFELKQLVLHVVPRALTSAALATEVPRPPRPD
jgi:hypothetical protein